MSTLCSLLQRIPHAQFVPHEIIELENKALKSYGKIAPIVRVAHLDITEVLVTGSSLKKLVRIEIRRHPITDEGPMAEDVGHLRLIKI